MCFAIKKNKCLKEIEETVTVKVKLDGINGTETNKNVLYPDGFGKDNSAVIGLAYQVGEGIYKRNKRYDVNGCYYSPYCDLGGNYMEVGMISSTSSATTSYDSIYVYVTLAKTTVVDGVLMQ